VDTHTAGQARTSDSKLKHSLVSRRSGFAVLGATVLLLLQASGHTPEHGYWPFEEGSGNITADASGNGNTGTLVNGPVWVAGKVGNALRFDGVNDYVDAGNSSTLNPTAALSVVAWINPSTTVPTQVFIGKYLTDFQYFLRLQGPRVRFAVKAGGTGASMTSNGVIAPNTWYHIVGTYDGSQMRVYINGALDSSLAKTGAMIDNGNRVNIGGRGGVGMYFNGLIDDARVYDRALSDSEVLALYNSGSGIDPARSGQWSAQMPWPTVAIHLALLHTGEVLSFSNGQSSYLWNPSNGSFTHVPNQTTNIFCSGHAMLADGKLLVVGGDESASAGGFLGAFDTNIFDPVTRTWTLAAPMAYRRWYPTATTLPDGRVLATSGAMETFTAIAAIPEVYNPQTNAWAQLPGANLVVPFYEIGEEPAS